MRPSTRPLACAWLGIGMAVLSSPAVAAACGPLQAVTSLPLTPLGPGNVVTVPVLIGDSPRTLMVDTGGFASSITRRTARELNLPTMRTVDAGRVVNVTGAYSDQMVRLPSITIGNLRQEGAYFFLDPTEDDPTDPTPPAFDGILGPEMFGQFDSDFDFGANRLNLISPDHCAGTVAYWGASSIAVVPFRLDRSNHITFTMRLDGKRITAMVDTGATNTNLNLNIARRMFGVDLDASDVERIGTLTGSYTANVYRRRFESISFEGVTVKDPMIVLLPDFMNQGAQAPRAGSLISPDPAAPPLILGMSVLSKLHLYIAYKERKLYISEANPETLTQ